MAHSAYTKFLRHDEIWRSFEASYSSKRSALRSRASLSTEVHIARQTRNLSRREIQHEPVMKSMAFFTYGFPRKSFHASLVGSV